MTLKKQNPWKIFSIALLGVMAIGLLTPIDAAKPEPKENEATAVDCENPCIDETELTFDTATQAELDVETTSRADGDNTLQSQIDGIKNTLNWVLNQLDDTIEGSLAFQVLDNTLAIERIAEEQLAQDDRLDSTEGDVGILDTRVYDIETTISEQPNYIELGETILKSPSGQSARETYHCPQEYPFFAMFSKWNPVLHTTDPFYEVHLNRGADYQHGETESVTIISENNHDSPHLEFGIQFNILCSDRP